MSFTVLTHIDGPITSRPHGSRIVFSRLEGLPNPVDSHAPEPVIKFVMHGEERYRVGGRWHKVQPGQFLLVDRGTDYQIELPRQEVTDGLCLFMRRDDLRDALALPDIEQGDPFELPLVLLDARGSRMWPHLSRLARHVLDTPDLDPMTSGMILEEMTSSLADTLRETQGRLSKLDAARESTRLELMRRLERARGFLLDSLDRIVSLDEVARHAGMSPFHLNRCFRQVYGDTPARYHTAARLDRAADYLRRGRMSVTQTAALMGYSDIATFSKAFKRRFGVSPSRAGTEDF